MITRARMTQLAQLMAAFLTDDERKMGIALVLDHVHELPDSEDCGIAVLTNMPPTKLMLVMLEYTMELQTRDNAIDAAAATGSQVFATALSDPIMDIKGETK